MDVAQAVDKPDLEAARARLADAAAARRSGAAFSLAETSGKGATAPGKESFVQFESMVLRNFVEAMLPKESEAVYGKGLAGDMWKSMMAERVADVVAERGGIGISDRVLGDFYMDGDRKVAVAGVSRGPEREALNTQSMLSEALVQEIQRNVMKAYDQDSAPISSIEAGTDG
jgi:Rod binding domain-containing protein